MVEHNERNLEPGKTQETTQTDEQQLAVNRKYKDTVFRMLFQEKKYLLSLYNAMNEKQYTDENALQIITLDNAIYMEMKNDLAFVIDTNLYLYEHQSTKNPNMPLRNLFYIAKEYQKLVEQKSLYSTVIQKIPTPRFVVFYNGIDEMEDRSELLLSSAYVTETTNPDLELRVTVLNVNHGHNIKLLENCPILDEYAQYVEKVRGLALQPGMTLEQAVEKAVNQCIEQGILREFLLKNKSEAVAMSIFEYNKEEEMKKYRRAEREGAIEEGIDIGIEIGIEQNQKAVILRLLAKHGEVPEELRSRIEKESELKVLEEWFELAVETNSIEEFQAKYWVEK